MTAMRTTWLARSCGYGIRPENHSGDGGRNWTWANSTRICPTTRRMNRASNVHRAQAVGVSLRPSAIGAASQLVREHLFVMPVPGALEQLPRVVLLLQPQEVHEPRIARLHLRPGRPAVVRQ